MRIVAGACLRQLARRSFVPQSKPVVQSDVDKIEQFVSESNRLLVLTGAGISTESGIPDYRSEEVGLYARTDHRPMQYQEFIKSAARRQTYWARNFVGWPQFASFQPNESHTVLSQWENAGKVHWLVTQNVDALHTKAGHVNVTELHGCSHRVVCLSCDIVIPRWELQEIFKQYNPDWNITSDAIAPDGDVLLTKEQVNEFKVPPCPGCGGVLKPDVTFFGDNVPRKTVDFMFQKVEDSDGILVAGSSLFVYSGYRFIRHASEHGIPVAILNIGTTRADHMAKVKVEAKCGEVLPKVKLY